MVRDPGQALLNSMRACDNPFATHRVLQVRYRPQGETWDDLLRRLEQRHWRGAIVGPNGSGKTTCLEDLEVRLRARGFTTHLVRLSEEAPGLPEWFAATRASGLTAQDVVLLDGCEQLGWWAWRRLARHTRNAGGFIVTSHQAGRLPTVLACRPSFALVEDLLEELLGDAAASCRDRALRHFREHHGNVREVLRCLYDFWADGPRTPAPTHAS